MSAHRITIVLAAAGVLILSLSLLADVIGLGLSPGFGRRHQVGVAAGLAFLAVGVYRWRR
ncbi:MAG: hypothetical protein ACE5FP_05820 [Gemmatimonadota bacterium]